MRQLSCSVTDNFNRQTAVYSYNKILFSNKKRNLLLRHEKTWESLDAFELGSCRSEAKALLLNYTQSANACFWMKKASLKYSILCNFNDKIFCKKKTYEAIRPVVGTRSSGRWINRWGTEYFQNIAVLEDTVIEYRIHIY